MSDLVSGLLAVIGQREKEHHRVAEELREAARSKMHVPNADYVRATIKDGLALCLAHRAIVEQYQSAAKRPAELTSDRAHGSYVLEAEAVAEALRRTLQALAEGYGLREEDNSE